ncbi:hypothetical protein M378DRAFT_181917 [Amanita muscaria Koide BX008]|uniref:Zn(2)-C6 fungal-type domain-containing protein n=1 Tax=Amanita muscaria (strain Koide BX008) TaxID=946122 RepID=A0A0C2WIW5_AMAMK|nr:hypothetical protein M378DRAFT_181917 [Amanita muscaria Koide BX008]
MDLVSKASSSKRKREDEFPSTAGVPVIKPAAKGAWRITLGKPIPQGKCDRCRLDRYECVQTKATARTCDHCHNLRQGCNYDGVSITGRAKVLRKEAGKGKGKSRAIVKDDADEEGGSDSESSGEDGRQRGKDPEEAQQNEPAYGAPERVDEGYGPGNVER